MTAPSQPHFDYHLFETKLHNWLIDVPPANLDITGPLPEPLQVVQRRGHSGVTHVKSQLATFWATSGTLRWPCPTLQLSIKAPGGLYPWSKTPTAHVYVPIVSISTLSVDDVRGAFAVAARDLLKEEDARETLRGQPLVRGLVEQQIATLRVMIGAMPPSVWKLSIHQHKISPVERSFIWDSQFHDVYHKLVGSQYEPFVEYVGPQGRLYQKLDQNTGSTILTFVIDEIVEFEWQYIVPPWVLQSTQFASAEQVRGMILNSLYINY